MADGIRPDEQIMKIFGVDSPMGAFFEYVRRSMRELRESTGLSQRQVAEKMGTYQSNITKIECNLYPRLQLATLWRFADACGYDVEIIFHKHH